MSIQPTVTIDPELCTGCGRCVETCPVQAIAGSRGKAHEIEAAACVSCGRCVATCAAFDSIFDAFPTPRPVRLKRRGLPGSLKEPLFAAHDPSRIEAVRKAFATPKRMTVMQVDTMACVALAEDFGLPPGSLSPLKIASAARQLGFDRVYRTSFPAGLAVLETAHEMAARLANGGNLPVINSSCPAVVAFLERRYPELLHYLSTVKSPHQIAGALYNSYLADAANLAPANIHKVSVVACLSHKAEAERPEMMTCGCPDIDTVLTARELAILIKDAGIDVPLLGDGEFDNDFPEIEGLDTLYCAPGDVSRAVLGAGRWFLGQGEGVGAPAGETVEVLDEATRLTRLAYPGGTLQALTVAGFDKAVPYLEAIKAGRNAFQFLEIASCPQGCASGAGLPKVLLETEKPARYRARIENLPPAAPEAWSRLPGHPSIVALYGGYFGKAIGDKSNRRLHTQYAEPAAAP
ncbi:[Fe-Fe] hydrogenase large subunit C-terminal domain-containing protein [Rhodospirillum rubrum]|uniref:Ferredoxin hydrogenase n=1 Tax=Rhodospirillum rubrum (strain ATCC 11170 / ATH 1.1.1 / DSM 467 / LMG 4362 / NCIMB 8255 / S1) TaxID=269796 RepID=Q2RXN0_RHORT|nr:[Fe-Fe] hydrogenase large subunit C-terminal domain-containing protein [Rhodospirillum rubrum]ABC21115.1 Ferredoxin hydrogenase [Rhodospirillum rubrum ATCC 11170]AEO46783.1 ferredoxin hydrogenase [Rhodospirillum rubrum F11]MBK5952662.1 ferredoxin hydrogenase [Rhodospirillum rubrum]QXG80807.1 4Fe-4S binding protein [Rhodospirillum rubrum]HAQ00277.1 ferredoxin hydrogenase [Rhodospirillum rubrum]